jgi:cell wall-associated NlpC family hydrolase
VPGTAPQSGIPTRVRVFVAALVAAACGAGLTAVPAHADPNGIESTDGVSAEIGRLSAQLNDADQRLRKASVTAETAIERYERAVVRENRAARALRKARAAEQAAGRRVDRQSARVGAAVRENYELGGTVQATAMVIAGRPSDFLNNMGYLHYVGDRQARALGGYRQAKGRAVLAAGGARSALAARTSARRTAAAQKQRAQDAVDRRAAEVSDIKQHKAGLEKKLDNIESHNAKVRSAARAAERRQAAARAADRRRADRATADVNATPTGYESGSATVAVRAALAQVGKAYVWDAADPGVGFDCSGLVLYAYEQLGIYLPHSAMYQYSYGYHVSAGNLRPGDLLFYSYNGRVSGIHHVTMYIGHGMIVQAADFGIPVEVVPAYFDFGYIGATRLV